MTLFCIVIKILKQIRLSSKPPGQNMATSQLHYHSWSQHFTAGKPFFHVSSLSATVGVRRNSGDDAVTQQQNVLFFFIYQCHS